MTAAKILNFPGKAPAVVVSDVPAVKPLRASLVNRFALGFFRTLALAIVILNKPLRVVLSLCCSWYCFRWAFLEGATSSWAGWVALASFLGIAAVHFTVLTVARNRR